MEYTEFKEVEVPEVPEKAERDPILDMDISLVMKVEDVNILLALLAKLPYEEVANVLSVIRNDVVRQIQEKTQSKPTAE